MNIVLVADDVVLPEFLRRPLSPLGHRLSVVDSLADLQEQLTTLEPRAVFLPRRLVDASIDDATAWLRANASGPLATVMIGLEASDKLIADRVGADAFLQIPFADRDVLDVLGVTTRQQKVVLLADDSPMIHRHTEPILREAGYRVVSAMDGDEGLVLAREHHPDLVITDIEMPRMDGYELCKRLKEDPDLGHVPVLISSSLGEAHDLERGFDSGADDYLVKPVIPEELTTRVKQLLSGAAPASRESILVVDDSPAQRHYVADCLARQGFAISTAENGRVALELAIQKKPALIISDYEMPEMTGFELVHALKRWPDTRNIPVVMLTARDSKRDMAQMKAAGASAYLVKPFAQDKCIATVERTLAEQRLLAYKEASSLYISAGARRAAELRAEAGDMSSIRAEERDMSVLFSDLVGFTTMSLHLGPREVIDILNAYFDVMCPIVLGFDGDIDKFIGDAIMAVFDDISGKAPPAERAVRAALAMQEAMPAFNREHAIPLAMRIGINTGPLVRGDLGSRFFRRDYTVIGDTVNRANRYETKCPVGGVLVSASTREQLGAMIEVEELPGLELKGVDVPVTGYVVRTIVPEEGAQ